MVLNGDCKEVYVSNHMVNAKKKKTSKFMQSLFLVDEHDEHGPSVDTEQPPRCGENMRRCGQIHCWHLQFENGIPLLAHQLKLWILNWFSFFCFYSESSSQMFL